MSSAIEAMGMSLPYNSSNPAVSDHKLNEKKKIASSILNLIQNDIKPSDIITRKSIENAVRLITILGGSTNAVLHILAICKTANIDFNIDDFQKISNETPLLGNLKPSGKFLMEDLHNIGGIPSVLRFMMDEGMLNTDCLTVTGKTIGQNLEETPKLDSNQDIIMPIDKPIKNLGILEFFMEILLLQDQWQKLLEKKVWFLKELPGFSIVKMMQMKQFLMEKFRKVTLLL
jgi:dihydroxy-acid dehydratase